MILLSLGLTLLLASFLAALDHVQGLHDAVAHLGVQRWMTELALAVLVVALFFRMASLHRRMLFPRRGLRLLGAGIAVYALGVALGTGLVVHALAWLQAQAGLPASLSQFAGRLPAQVLLVPAQLLLVAGALRALCNLVSPAEFEADY